jgi:hypothetical protein
MVVVGDVLLAVTGAHRINYEILGNQERALHAHILPRYAHEPEALCARPAWFYDWEKAPPFDLRRDQPLMLRLRTGLEHAGVVV